jgi:WD40 repeat protein
MIKDYGAILKRDRVWSITTTPENKWLFAASNKRHLKQISLESQEVVHDYWKIDDDSFGCLETTRDNK